MGHVGDCTGQNARPVNYKPCIKPCLEIRPGIWNIDRKKSPNFLSKPTLTFNYKCLVKPDRHFAKCL